MAVVNFDDEMNRVLCGFESQAMALLEVMKMSFNINSASLVPDFKENFFVVCLSRLAETYDKFERNLMPEVANVANDVFLTVDDQTKSSTDVHWASGEHECQDMLDHCVYQSCFSVETTTNPLVFDVNIDDYCNEGNMVFVPKQNAVESDIRTVSHVFNEGQYNGSDIEQVAVTDKVIEGNVATSMQTIPRSAATVPLEGTNGFKCVYCEYVAASNSNLEKHIRIHTGEKPYQCEECPKKFTQLSNFKEHIRIYTGEKPYQCKECPKKFTQLGHFKTHMRTHRR